MKAKVVSPSALGTEMASGSQEKDSFFLTAKVGRRKLQLSCPAYGITQWYRNYGDMHTRGAELEDIADFLHYHGGMEMDSIAYMAGLNFITNSISRQWADLFAEIIIDRKRRGMHDAFDPISAMLVMSESDPQVQQVLVAEGVRFCDGAHYPNYRSLDELTHIMKLVVEHPQLREKYVQYAKLYTQYSAYSDYDWLAVAIMSELPPDTRICDVGAGDCNKIMQLANTATEHRFVAIERQNLGRLFPHRSKPDNLTIHCGDYLEDTVQGPFDAIICGAVWGHQRLVTARALATKMHSQLKDGGYIFSTQQESGCFGDRGNIAVHQRQGSGFVQITDKKFGRMFL